MDSRIKRMLKKPTRLFVSLGHRELFNWMNDETYIKIIYRICMGKKLNLGAAGLYRLRDRALLKFATVMFGGKEI